MDSIQIRAIGKVITSVSEKVYEKWGEVTSEIHLEPIYLVGLEGLGDYSHAIVIFFMDQFRENSNETWKRKPRGIEKLAEIGCFAQRTKYRPNPIGISVVEILSIENAVITVKGLDANHNTPVLDIKPYIPEMDKRENVIVPDWMKELMKDYF